MATRYVKQAGGQLNPVYSGAIKDVQAQIPATETLYTALLGGLESQANAGVGSVVDSAERRGVGRARLGQDVAGSIGAALQLQRATLGAQKAEDVAGITGQLSELRTGKVNETQGLGDRIQNIALAVAENKLTLKQAKEQYGLDLLKLERSAEIERLRAAQAAAASGGGGGGDSGGTTGAQSDVQWAYNEVKSRGADVSDYEATRKSALNGNQRDKLKLELYHRSYPGAFGRSVSSDAINVNKVRF